jgi:hypothetical protein
VEHLVAGSPESAAALWGLVGSGSSAAPTVHTYLDPRDPVTLALGGLPETEVLETPWMARVIDLAAAFGSRGFGPHLSVEAELAVDDAEAPRNCGRWSLRVAGGRGSAERVSNPSDDRADVGASHRAGGTDGAGDGVLHVGARGLSALWCGWSVSRLRQAGLATGGTPDGDAALDAVFACAPYLTEYF